MNKIQTDIVSLITPCYNSEEYVGRLLDSVLRQDYPMIEMIAVDDGSTDGTADVVLSYIPLFEKKGYKLSLLKQSHLGQSEAINHALKSVTGHYVAWPDSDDYYSRTDSISKLASALDASDETVGAARCLPVYVDEYGKVNERMQRHEYNLDKEWLFEDAVNENNGFRFLSGGFMVKMKTFDRCISNRTISTALNAGQNYQLLLPILHDYKCITVKEQLITIVLRDNSHSRGQYSTFPELQSKYNDFRKVFEETIDSVKNLENSDQIRIKSAYNHKIDQLLFSYAKNLRCARGIRYHRNKLLKSGVNISIKDNLLYYLTFFPGGEKFIRLI